MVLKNTNKFFIREFWKLRAICDVAPNVQNVFCMFFFLISKENFIKKGPSILGVYKRTNKS